MRASDCSSVDFNVPLKPKENGWKPQNHSPHFGLMENSEKCLFPEVETSEYSCI